MKKRWQRGLVLLATTFVVLEAASWFSLWLLENASRVEKGEPVFLLDERQREAIANFIEAHAVWYQQFDAHLGWVNAGPFRHREPNGEKGESRGFIEYTQNSAGARAKREYAVQADRGIVRVAAFGDSFVHGDEVDDEDVWSTRLEEFEPSIEVLNFGVSGYGVDQAYLRYLRDGQAFSPHIVILGIIVDDVWRNVNVFRPFLAPGTGHQMTKPRFLLKGRELRLLPNPLGSISDYQRLLDDPEAAIGVSRRYDAYFPRNYRSTRTGPLFSLRIASRLVDEWARSERPDPLGNRVLERNTEAYRLTLALIEAFAEAARRDGSIPLILFLPEAEDVRRRQAGKPVRYAPLLEDLGERVWWIDVDRNFAQWAPTAPVEELFRKFHYSPGGNELLARSVADALRHRGLVPGGRD